MSAQLMEFNPYLVDAVAMMALSPQDAWRLELLMENDEDLTLQDQHSILWINLVNTPAKYLQAQ